jgi:hypothetical protein
MSGDMARMPIVTSRRPKQSSLEKDLAAARNNQGLSANFADYRRHASRNHAN